MIEKPSNLDTEHVARVTALFDAFVALGTGSLMVHETSAKHLAYIAWAWANDRGLKWAVVCACSCDGGAYESWDLRFGNGTLYIFPREMGLLTPDADNVKAKIAEIQSAANAQIKALLGEVRP